MRRQKTTVASLAALLALALACGGDSKDPLTPSGAPGGAGGATAGETLKVGAPTPVSPINDQQPTLLVLTAAPPATKFAVPGALQYNYEVLNATNTVVVNDTVPSLTYTVTTPLDFGKKYTWHVRAMSNGSYGPWSTLASFVAPAGGYNVPGELYDPLLNGRSIGTVNGSADFIPGVGVRLNDNNAYINYDLPSTISSGEISAVITNLCSCSGQPGIKTRVFSMSQGYDNMTDNDRRFTVEKRSGSDKGVVAWRMITRQDQIDTEGAERVFVQFDPSHNYLWRAAYGGGYFELTVDDLTVGGRVYQFGKSYHGEYNPIPHVAFLGAPPSTSGPQAGTVANMIVRHLWVSTRPRVSGITQ